VHPLEVGFEELDVDLQFRESGAPPFLEGWIFISAAPEFDPLLGERQLELQAIEPIGIDPSVQKGVRVCRALLRDLGGLPRRLRHLHCFPRLGHTSPLLCQIHQLTGTSSGAGRSANAVRMATAAEMPQAMDRTIAMKNR
jgi:hypothetical protein